MATWQDIERVVATLPGVVEATSHGNRAWKVGGTAFVWARPLRQRDCDELGAAAPAGDIVGVRVPGPVEKDALVQHEGPAIFTVDHFEGFNAVLIQLDAVDADLLADLVEDAWRDRAPKRLRDAWDLSAGGTT